jgi:predicted permease
MASPLITLIPFFALVLIGYFSAHKGLVDSHGVKGLNAFVFYFALPALLFDKTQGADMDKLIHERAYLLAYLCAALGVFAIAWLGAKLIFKAGPGRASVLALAGVYGNIGFMGIPVLTTAVGDWVAVPLALIVLVDVAVSVPLATTIIDMTRPDGQRRNLKGAVAAAVLKNPIVAATLAGLGVAALGLTLPVSVNTFTELLGRSAGPAAMFTLGAVLANRPLSHGLGEALYASVFKLAVYPFVIWWSMTAFSIGADWRLAATLGAAMPMATVLFVIAQQYQVMAQRTSTAILLSTIFAMATVSLLTAWLTP